MKRKQQYHWIEKFGSKLINEQLEPYVTSARKQRIDQVITGRLHSIELAMEAPSDINNALAAVRSSEALGIAKVHIINAEGGAGAARTITQGAVYWVDVCFYDSLDEFLAYIKTENILLAGGMADADTPLNTVPIDHRLCFILGNEQRGLTPQAQTACDIRYYIPMYGMSESFNLSVSAGMSLYDATTRKRLALQKVGDLNVAQQAELRARYYLNSVSPRLAEGLLAKQDHH